MLTTVAYSAKAYIKKVMTIVTYSGESVKYCSNCILLTLILLRGENDTPPFLMNNFVVNIDIDLVLAIVESSGDTLELKLQKSSCLIRS